MYNEYVLPEPSELLYDENDVAYFYNYVKTKFWNKLGQDDESVLTSKALLNFKEKRCSSDIKEWFMRDIAGYLQGFTFMDYSNVVIIPVPSSKGYKYSCIINAVKRIFHIMDNSINESALYLGLDSPANFIDGTGILKRTTNVIPMKYLWPKPSIEEVKQTISFYDRDPSIIHDDIVLIDDIITTGTTMNACKELLIENGVNPYKIHCFALAKTGG